MKRPCSAFAAASAFVAALAASAPQTARAADASLEVCGDLSAKPADVVHHCRRALDGGLDDRAAFAVGLNLGAALLELGRPDAALDALAAAEALGFSRVELHVFRADAFEALERRREAGEAWAKAVASAPDSLDVRLGEGAFHLRAGALDPALAAFDAALAREPDDPTGLFNRGLTLIALGKGEAAERDFTRLLSEAPNDAGAYHHRARAKAERDDAGALRDFDRAIKLAPEWSEPWYRSGLLLDRIGRTEDANLRFRRAFELGETDPWLLERIKSFGG
ncbi:MAG: hypothetical protein AAGF90_01135 [Pseudomonadota bacterium]